jgi:hypothetical protein
MERVIRQFDDMCLTAAHAPRRTQDDVGAAEAREELASETPAVTVARTRKTSRAVVS